MKRTLRLRASGATTLATCLAVAALLVAMLQPSIAAAAARLLGDALPAGHASCHARVLSAAEKADPARPIVSLAIERTAPNLAAERKWAALEQFDDTPIVSATLRVRLRNDPATHTARLECTAGDDGALVCTTPACAGGEIRITPEGVAGLAVSVGGRLKSGRFIRHYIHLDDSCERATPVVLEAEDERPFSLATAPKEACR